MSGLDSNVMEQVQKMLGGLPGGAAGMVGQVQGMMGNAAVMLASTAKYTMASTALEACTVMNKLKNEGHFPMGQPQPDNGKWLVFYWERKPAADGEKK